MATVSELTDKYNAEMSGVSPQLQSIIDKITGSSGSINEKKNLVGAAGILGGLQEKTMQDTAALERTKLGEAGATERAKIGIMPGMAENQRKSQMFNFPGIGATPAQPATGNWWENWK